MSLDFALNLVDQAADLGVFSQAGFTGGEPLLFFDEIIQICQRLYQYNLKYSMISSCFWATSDAETHRIIDPLVQWGLEVMSISYDPSHGKWVDRENVRRVVKAVNQHGLTAVVCASFFSASDNLQEIFPEFVDDPQVELVNRIVLPAGKAARRDLTPQAYGIEVNTSAFACYKRIYHDLTVFWDGEAYPCCSVYNRATPGISLGNLYDLPLAEIWDRVEGSLMYRVMKRQGFSALYKIIEEFAPDLMPRLPDPSLAVGPCELCHQVFKDPAMASQIKKVFDKYERNRIASLLDAVEQVAGVEKVRSLLDQVLA